MKTGEKNEEVTYLSLKIYNYVELKMFKQLIEISSRLKPFEFYNAAELWMMVQIRYRSLNIY
jgi:hypothetical protein